MAAAQRNAALFKIFMGYNLIFSKLDRVFQKWKARFFFVKVTADFSRQNFMPFENGSYVNGVKNKLELQILKKS